MTYRERFTASQDRAHYQNIATKILREMNDLRSKAQDSPLVPRRWVWELIQNAKDVHQEDNGGVNIQIELKENGEDPVLIFQHDGKPFSADNIRFLIEQISTKDRSKDETGKRKMTGKFGTGFLATHMLAEKVLVQGVAKENDLPAKQFSMTLDRSSYDIDEIIGAVDAAKNLVLDIDTYETYSDYDPKHLNTSFNYALEDELSINIAKAGIEDLKRCIPYSLVFVREITSVYLENEDLFYYYDEEELLSYDQVKIHKIKVERIKEKETALTHRFATLSKGFTTIAVPVNVTGDLIEILPIEDVVPTLFCDFPLVGTEVFPFPVIVNDPHFTPSDTRDGVSLNVTDLRPNPNTEENKRIISDAISLFYELLEYASENGWKNLHLLAKVSGLKENITWVNDKWFNDTVLKPIRSEILHAKIVIASDGELRSILTEDGKHFMWFPYDARKSIRDGLWNLASKWFPHCIPVKDDIDLWYKLAWEECGKLTTFQLAIFIEGCTNLKGLQENLTDKSAYDWLNSYYELLKNSEGEYDLLVDKKEVVPDQNGDFSRRSQLSLDAGDIIPELKNILEEFGRPIKSDLADEEIELDFEERVLDLAHVVREITVEVSQKTSTRELKESNRTPLNHLLLFFRNFPEKAKKLFPSVYSQKHLLYDDDEILENIAKAEVFDDLLKDYNVTTADELRALLGSTPQNNDSRLLQITEDILANMGISNIGEWEIALQDQDLQAMFTHNSVPTTDMFVYAQSLIEEAKKNIILHLETLHDYDLTQMEETATTVLGGILKHGEEINIVCRPAYNDEVIIYYGSERATLAHSLSELWVDDGISVRQITIGHLLEKAKIKKFPI